MHIIYDTDTQEFFSFTKKIIEPGNIRMYSPFVAPVDKGIWLTACPQPHLVVRITEIGMRSTSVMISGTELPQLVPCFVGVSGGPGIGVTVTTDLTFVPEEDQRMALVFNLDDGTTSLFAFARNKQTNEVEFFQPGVPNTFSSGKLCLGRAAVPIPSTITDIGLVPWLTEWVAAWSSAPFNSDLIAEHHVRTLQFDPMTQRNKLLGDDWRGTYPKATVAENNSVKAMKGVLEYAGTNL
jgi:hypothetical protein